MSRVLIVNSATMNTEPVVDSLRGHRVQTHNYFINGAPPDRAIMDAASLSGAGTIVYIGCNGGPYMPSASTFTRLRKAGKKTVALIFDAADATWEEQLEAFRKHESFDLVVAIDGNDDWQKVTANDFTALTPISPHWFQPQKDWHERPIAFAFAGGYASPSRAAIVNGLIESAGLVVPRRNEQYGSYNEYSHYLTRCRTILNVPWSGFSESRQVKGRVIEAGLAGCLLLDHRDSATERWFTPDVDYQTYGTVEEARLVQGWYDARPQSAAIIAKSLQRRILDEHSPESFWARIFERIGA
jgi:hypothetical protein